MSPPVLLAPAWLAASWIPGALFGVHLGATLVMAGVIWFVQVVHYPLFGAVGEEGFRDYADEHGRRTTWVVAPPMLAELATGVALLWRRPGVMPLAWAWAGVGLLAVVWASTFALQVPRHDELRRGFDRRAHQRLVRGNWVRTIAWTARAGLVLAAAARAVGAA